MESHDSVVLAEIRALREHIEHRSWPRRHAWLRHIVKGLEEDPAVQARVHRIACYYWLANFPVVIALFFGFPKVWVAIALFINTIYSLYANLATDYDGLSSSQASLHAVQARERAEAAARAASKTTE